MKVEQYKEFKPVHIILETQEEFENFQKDMITLHNINGEIKRLLWSDCEILSEIDDATKSL